MKVQRRAGRLADGDRKKSKVRRKVFIGIARRSTHRSLGLERSQSCGSLLAPYDAAIATPLLIVTIDLRNSPKLSAGVTVVGDEEHDSIA
jgi:hypothetical protein